MQVLFKTSSSFEQLKGIESRLEFGKVFAEI